MSYIIPFTHIYISLPRNRNQEEEEDVRPSLSPSLPSIPSNAIPSMTEFPRREPTFQHSPPLWKEMGRGKEKNIYIYIYIWRKQFSSQRFYLVQNLSCYLSVLISAVSVVRRHFTIRHPFRRRCKVRGGDRWTREAHATFSLLYVKSFYIRRGEEEGEIRFSRNRLIFFFSSLVWRESEKND